MELTDTAVFALTPKAVDAPVGEDVLVLHLEDGQYFGLESVGARIWRLLEEPTSIEAIVRVLLDEYDIEPERCRAEVQRLISRLVERNLVEMRDS